MKKSFEKVIVRAGKKAFVLICLELKKGHNAPKVKIK